jgi:hypothetical protein
MDRQALVEAILDLEHDRESQVADADLAQDLGDHVKELVDELVSLRGGEPGAEADATTGEGARKKRRKKRLKKGEKPPGPVPQILSVAPGEQARWIFLERYISLEQHEDIFRINFQPETFAEHQDSFDRLIKDLLLLPRALELGEKNDVPGLQRLFASCVPIFRHPEIGDDSGGPIDSSIENLRQCYPSYFYKRRKKPNWFEAQDFYREPVQGPRWVLCDTEYMNCTLRRPERKLGGFARDWDLPPEYAHQKDIVEDVYDRVIIGEALGEDLFSGNCNSLTSTFYRARRKGPRRLVYTVQKVHKVTIHGKVGIPHWRATRRLWPGVHPTLAFPDLTDDL